MQIQLFSYTGENNRIDKGNYLSAPYTMNGNLREGTSILQPEIRIQKSTPPMNSQYNYMYIPEFKRYYFITDIVSPVNGLWTIKARVDVLFTYINQIYDSKAILDKSENEGNANLYYNDGSFIMDARRYNQVLEFPSGLSEQGYNILICAGGV